MIGRFCAAFLIAALLAPAAQAGSTEEFYKGKQVRVVVGASAGGGYDLYARLLARYIGKYIPGHPNVVVQNMPGAASLLAANYLYNVAPKDGTVFGTFERGLPLQAVLGGNSNIKFDPTKFTWLGSTASAANDAFLLFARKDAKVRTLDELRQAGGPTLIVGVTAKGASDTETAKLLREALRLNIRTVSGYPASGEIFLAIDRGELDARLLGLSAANGTKPDWLRSDSGMHVLVQTARTTRHPLFPTVPTARELAGDARSLALVELGEMAHQIPRPFAGPPGMPIDRAKALQRALVETAKDPDYQAEAKKLDLEVTAMHGEEVLAIINRMSQFPSDIREQLRIIHEM
jgi:tripartite-type tricarboxylate transporter receptor subunit TctC